MFGSNKRKKTSTHKPGRFQTKPEIRKMTLGPVKKVIYFQRGDKLHFGDFREKMLFYVLAINHSQ
jgi:hypothetical protein